MYSFGKISLSKEKIKESLKSAGKTLKETAKKGVVKGKEIFGKYLEDFEMTSDPHKTTAKYSKSFFYKMNKGIKESDEDFRAWREWAIKKFAQFGYQAEQSLFTTDQNQNISTITFDFQKIAKYDLDAKRFWEQKVYATRYWEEKWKAQQEEGRWWENKPQPFQPSGRIWEQQPKEKEIEYQKEMPPANLKEIKIIGTLNILLLYNKERISVEMLIDFQDPRVRDIDQDFLKRIARLVQLIIKNLSYLLYSEFTTFEVNKLVKKIDESIPAGVGEEKLEKEIGDIINAFFHAEEDLAITNDEIDLILKEIRDIPDRLFQEDMVEIVNKLKNVNDPLRMRELFKQAKKIISHFKPTF